MRERTLADEADGHDIPGTWFLVACREFYYTLFPPSVDACDQCVELPKTARQPAKSPGKGKKSEPVKQDPLFDHHEGLVHDIALKAHLQRGYELFKVSSLNPVPVQALTAMYQIRHGSFTSIFETLGQQALELQLERFFTVWAWSWDMEEQPDFSLHLGGSCSALPPHRDRWCIEPVLGRKISPSILQRSGFAIRTFG